MKARTFTPILVLALAIGGTVTVSTAVARVQGAAEDDGIADRAGAVNVLQQEIDSMVAGGMRPDHPKIQRLREDLEALRKAGTVAVPGEPGLDLTSSLGPRRTGSRSAGEELGTASQAVEWDRGDVECEPIPPDQLTAADVADARCVSAPQPDGTNRYLAIRPDGTVRVVRFDTTGQVTREPDIQIDLVGSLLEGLDLTVDILGDVLVTVSGTPDPSPLTTIDVR